MTDYSVDTKCPPLQPRNISTLTQTEIKKNTHRWNTMAKTRSMKPLLDTLDEVKEAEPISSYI